MSSRLEVWAPDGLPEIAPGDDLVELLTELLRGDPLVDGDVLVLTSKVVSKAEGRVVSADDREQAITDETVRVVATPSLDGGRIRTDPIAPGTCGFPSFTRTDEPKPTPTAEAPAAAPPTSWSVCAREDETTPFGENGADPRPSLRAA